MPSDHALGLRTVERERAAIGRAGPAQAVAVGEGLPHAPHAARAPHLAPRQREEHARDREHRSHGQDPSDRAHGPSNGLSAGVPEVQAAR
jgi:hypothetical protein